MSLMFEVGGKYHNRDGEYEVIETDGNTMLVRYTEGAEARLNIRIQERIARNMRDDEAASTSKRVPKQSSSGTTRATSSAGTAFSRAETSPLIAKLISQHSAASKDYMTRQEIIAAILNDVEGRRLVTEAQQKWPDTDEHIAGNMIDWFSQEITTKTSTVGAPFERTRAIDRRWAYRLRRDH